MANAQINVGPTGPRTVINSDTWEQISLRFFKAFVLNSKRTGTYEEFETTGEWLGNRYAWRMFHVIGTAPDGKEWAASFAPLSRSISMCAVKPQLRGYLREQQEERLEAERLRAVVPA